MVRIMNEERLNAFERMLSDILAQYHSVIENWRRSRLRKKRKPLPIASFLQTNCNIKRYCRTTGHTDFWRMIRNNGGTLWHLKIN